MSGDYRAARQKGAQGHYPQSSYINHLCSHCMIAGLAQKPWAFKSKRVSPCILSIAGEGVFIFKGNCHKLVTQYHSLLAKIEC